MSKPVEGNVRVKYLGPADVFRVGDKAYARGDEFVVTDDWFNRMTRRRDSRQSIHRFEVVNESVRAKPVDTHTPKPEE